jgi:hypothetical protein
MSYSHPMSPQASVFCNTFNTLYYIINKLELIMQHIPYNNTSIGLDIGSAFTALYHTVAP